jgi:shikimate dehydrogenase
MNLSGKAKVAGVIGWPVSHSLSPRLHGFWLREHQVDGAYVPLAVRREDFAVAISGLRASGFAGVNVTVPHKEAAFALAHDNDEAARAGGAVNLLLFRGDRIVGRNTDIEGLRASLAESLGANCVEGKSVVVLGAGGAARAAVLAADKLGAAEVRLVNRTAIRMAPVVQALQLHAKAKLSTFEWAQWAAAATGAALLINTTAAGMTGAPPLDIALDPLPTNAAVCDVVYNPFETTLLKTARAAGHRTVDGLGMLMHQGVPAFAALYGVTPRVTPALRGELEKALRDAG